MCGWYDIYYFKGKPTVLSIYSKQKPDQAIDHWKSENEKSLKF